VTSPEASTKAQLETMEGPLVSTGKQHGGITGKGFLPGRSGNAKGRPVGDARMRGLMAESFRLSRKEAVRALRARWSSTKYVQDMVELYAKLEGELSKDAQEGARQGVDVIVVRGENAITPEEFRGNAEARMAREALAKQEEGR
jgi:hypothetical protein